RPPAIRTGDRQAAVVSAVAPASPAERAGVRQGDVVLAERRDDGREVDLSTLGSATPAARLATWRDLYRLGVSGAVVWTLGDGGQVRLPRRPARGAPAPPPGGAP